MVPEGSILIPVPRELAGQLTSDEGALPGLVVSILQQALASRPAHGVEGSGPPAKPVPFWLERNSPDPAGSGKEAGKQVEDALLDRIATRRMAENAENPPSSPAADQGARGD